jgi:hypothetical protein
LPDSERITRQIEVIQVAAKTKGRKYVVLAALSALLLGVIARLVVEALCN